MVQLAMAKIAKFMIYIRTHTRYNGGKNKVQKRVHKLSLMFMFA